MQNLDSCLEEIRKINEKKDAQIKALQDRLKALKEEYNKDEEIIKMQEKIDKAYDDLNRGFSITESEQEKINSWKDKHIRKKHWDKKNECEQYSGAIGGRFTYEFIPTSIGIIGTIKCSCGKEFIFQEP